MADKVVMNTSVPEGHSPELMIVFSHPTKDDLSARVFGKNGFAADEVSAGLRGAGIPVEKVHFTAMVKHGIGSKSKPSAEDIEEWSAELDKEIESLKPKLIMPLGAEVFKRIMKSNIKMGDYVGEITDTPYGKVLANYAPGMIVAMDPTKRPEFREVFHLAKRVLDNNLKYDEYRYVIIDNPEDNIKILNKYISEGRFHIGYDAEWFGSKFTDDEVMYEFQYSCEKDFAVVLNISKDGISENRELLDTMKLILEHPEAKRLGWNIRADDLRLRYRGFNIPDETLAFDGMKAVAYFDSRLSKGLETGIKLFTDYEPYYTALNRKLKEHKLAKSDMSKLKFIEPDIYYHYCAGDAVSHREACLRMMAGFPKHLKDCYKNIYLPLTHYITDMELTGIPVDKAVLEDITKKYSTKYEELKAELVAFLKDRFGMEDFNPNSAPKKKQLLFEVLNVEPAYYTKSGKSPKSKAWYDKQKPQTQKMYEPSTNSKSLSTIKFQLEALMDNFHENDEDKLEKLQATHKAITLLLSVSRVGVFATKFLNRKGVAIDDAEPDDEEEPLKQSYWAAICNDGRVHASFFECLKNFRASSSPNVQNPASKVLAYIPDIFVPGYSKMDADTQKQHNDKLPKNIRNIFYSGHPDYYWCELDVAGADLAIMAFLSQDQDFIHDIRAGNFHQTKMREYFNDATLTKKDVSKYTIAKSITFRVSYTAGLESAAMPIQADIYAENGLSVGMETLKYALSTWRRYKRYMMYRDQCTEEVKNHKRITNARGLILNYEETDNFGIMAGWMNESLAFPVASELAWFMWDCSVNLKNILKKEGLWMKYIFPVNTVHDAGYWSIHKDLVKGDYIQEVLKHVFCHQTKLATGDNVGCELVITDRWKGKEKIFEKETSWNFDKHIWEWKH
jgi:DNA polymerase I-like protein with 3'-5' exonuclease and polymerase domains/uracil-DNA glycosylase